MARKRRYIVQLTTDAKGRLLTLLTKGTAKARTLRRANILLLAAEGRSDSLIADAVHVSMQTVRNIRKRFTETGLDAALYEASRPGAVRKLTVKQEALLIALACSDPPAGRETWTMQLLADRLVELQVVAAISDETVRRTLKKMRSNRGRKSSGVSSR